VPEVRTRLFTEYVSLRGLQRRTAGVYEMSNEKSPKAGVFGKLAPREDPRTLKLSHYLLPDLSPPPEHYNALPRAEEGAKQYDPMQLFPMLGNDRYGDCTIAAAAHAETLWNSYLGKRRKPSRATVIREYFDMTGGDDTGLVMLDVCNRWRQKGITGERILAFAGVDRRKHDLIRQSVWLFGGVYLGFRVQADAIERFNRREIWVPSRLTNEGHAVWVYAYTPDWLAVLTWGSTQRATWDWFDSCADESFAIVPGEATLPGFTPGVNYEALKADLAIVAA
jgi:hypothetical protein